MGNVVQFPGNLEADRRTRTLLLQEAFAEQELAGEELNFERARGTVMRWLATA